MPFYYYHLEIELYGHSSSQLSTTHDDELCILKPDCDIFLVNLPSHHFNTSRIAKREYKKHHRSKTVSLESEASKLKYNIPPVPRVERRNSYLSRSGSSESQRKPYSYDRLSRKEEGASEGPEQDWRFDKLFIQSIDMTLLSSGEEGKAKAKGTSATAHAASNIGLATKGRYVPLDVKNTNIGWGVVHLYRDGQESYEPGSITTRSSGDPLQCKDKTTTLSSDKDQCTTLCILAVPSYMTPSDFLGFVGENTREAVSHFRLIKTERANKYMVLMKFREASKADAWYKAWNGKLFNSMEPENCHVVFVKSIKILTPELSRDPSAFPNMNNDPFTPNYLGSLTVGISAAGEPSSLAPLSAKPLAPPTPSLVELPTCPVCLERMDETTGLLTILCQHVFHCACLEKWRGSGCPVCRYTQSDTLLGINSSSDNDGTENECSVCGSTSNLWICLICGNTGCGRYNSAHAYAHWELTSHSFAMDIATQAVWDYAGDGYVHRLIQNKADGKLVDLPAAYSRNDMVGFGEDSVPREKLDNMGMEYAYLLTSQLDSQRAYFEEQVERAVDKAAKATIAAEEAAKSAALMNAQCTALRDEHNTARANISELERNLQRQSRKLQTSTELCRKLTKQYQDEKTMNEALMQRIKFLEETGKGVEETLKRLEIEKQEIEDQNRDLSFFISGQEKIKELEQDDRIEAGEIKAGSLQIPSDESTKKRKGKGRR